MNTSDIIRLEEGQTPGDGKLSELSWLSGYWRGTGLGGECDELWGPLLDNSMNGVFRYSKEDRINFSEYMIIIEEENSLTLKLKHYSRELEAWEAKEKWTTFKLVRLEEQAAYFSGLTYKREGNRLNIKLQLKSDDGIRIEEFLFNRADL